MENLGMVLTWAIFYTLHSVLASDKIKRILKGKWPDLYKYYRVFYSLLFGVLFLALVIQALFLPKIILFSTAGLVSHSGYLLATLGLVVLNRAFKNIAVSRFLSMEEKVQDELVISGIYLQVRHPMYLGLILIFAGYLLVAGNLASAIHLGMLLAYLPFGIYYEEKNLIRRFGEKYHLYKQEVPVLFPKFFVHKKKGRSPFND